MSDTPSALSLADLRQRLRPSCEKHRIRHLEIFGSAAHGQARLGSDVDMLVTYDDSALLSTAELLEIAGEAEELVGVPVDLVLRPSLEKSSNRFAREHILATAVCIWGMRNIVAHDYANVDVGIVREVATVQVPDVRAALERFFAEKCHTPPSSTP